MSRDAAYVGSLVEAELISGEAKITHVCLQVQSAYKYNVTKADISHASTAPLDKKILAFLHKHSRRQSANLSVDVGVANDCSAVLTWLKKSGAYVKFQGAFTSFPALPDEHPPVSHCEDPMQKYLYIIILKCLSIFCIPVFPSVKFSAALRPSRHFVVMN